MMDAAAAHALQIGETAVASEQMQQAHTKEMEVTLCAHSAEMERVRKVRNKPAFLLSIPFDLNNTNHTLL
jgi:ApbE superfamily uncharacterized protein (UPF0280 family)